MIPIYKTESRESVKVFLIINVVDVKCTESIVTYRPYRVVRLTTAERYVTEVKADIEGIGVVEGIVVSYELLGRRANVVDDVSCLIVPLPHIFDANLNTVFLGKRGKRAIEFDIS